ncbi:Uncharacterised protein [Neisseria meningitidis]|nr:Uncharacterised protein [Neisseria meningitidis]
MRFFKRGIAFVCQLDFEQGRIIAVAVAFETFLINRFSRQSFPVQPDARQLFIIEGGNTDFHFTAAVKINGIGKGNRDLFSKKAFQNFFRFRRVFELGFNVRLRAESAGERAVRDMVNQRNRLFQHCFQVVRQVFPGIIQQLRFQADDRRFHRGKPAALILVRFDGQEARFLQYFLLLRQAFFGFDTQIIRRAQSNAEQCCRNRNQRFFHHFKQAGFKDARIALFKRIPPYLFKRNAV